VPVKDIFPEDYRRRIVEAAVGTREIMSRFLNPGEIKRTLKLLEGWAVNPSSLYKRSGRLESLNKKAILLVMKGVAFSPSIFTSDAEMFDYAVAMVRRYYLEGRWYPLLAVNEAYLDEASPVMVEYTLEHEFYQMELYHQRVAEKGVMRFTREEKREISAVADKKAVEKVGISEDELIREKTIMLRVSHTSPLVPKPFAEACLYRYLQENLDELAEQGVASTTPREEEVGVRMSTDFQEWMEAALSVYRLYLDRLKRELEYLDYGYG